MKPLLALLLTVSLHAADFAGWSMQSPREEIRPQFSSGPDDTLIITHDQREGLDGWFQKSFEVKGGAWQRFEVKRKISGVSNPRQSCLVRILAGQGRGENGAHRRTE
jgi:hypothetical protein